MSPSHTPSAPASTPPTSAPGDVCRQPTYLAAASHHPSVFLVRCEAHAEPVVSSTQPRAGCRGPGDPPVRGAQHRVRVSHREGIGVAHVQIPEIAVADLRLRPKPPRVVGYAGYRPQQARHGSPCPQRHLFRARSTPGGRQAGRVTACGAQLSHHRRSPGDPPHGLRAAALQYALVINPSTSARPLEESP